MDSKLYGLSPEATDEDVTVVRFVGFKVSLDGEALQGIRDQLISIAEEPGQAHLLLDFGNVQYVSSMALGTLVSLHKNLLAKGRRLTIDNLSPQVHEVFAVTRLDKLLDLRLAEPEVRPGPKDGQAGSGNGVLVVDDEAAVRNLLEVGLQSRGFKVWLAAHGQQAIELYRRHLEEICVVLLDVVMPGMDGPQTLLALQKVSPAVRCCFMTGDPRPYTEEVLLQMGAVRVFRKPFAFAEVIDTLNNFTCRSAGRGAARWLEVPQQGV